eukprot:15017_5
MGRAGGEAEHSTFIFPHLIDRCYIMVAVPPWTLFRCTSNSSTKTEQTCFAVLIPPRISGRLHLKYGLHTESKYAFYPQSLLV